MTNRSAARTVAEKAEGLTPAQRKELLDELGLLTEDDQFCPVHGWHPSIVPDPTEDEVKTQGAPLSQVGGPMEDNRPTARRYGSIYDGPSPNGKYCPPGLRALFEGGEPVGGPPKPEAKTKPKIEKPKTDPRAQNPGVGRGNWRKLRPITHGRPSGVRAHQRRGEEPCDECVQARREYKAECDRRRRERLKPCGSPAAYQRHRDRGEPIDDACREAHNAEKRERRAARAA